MAGCYSTGDGTAPPGQSFYFPVGLAVSSGGNVLYVVNSDFDLQWNGGTLQSYDLARIRTDAVRAIADPTDPNLPWVRPPGNPGDCPGNPPLYESDGSQTRQPNGQTCAPPVDSTTYVRDSAVIGAFATDLQLSHSGTRLFSPVRGDASLTWADLAKDDPRVAPPADPKAFYAPFEIDCGARTRNRCDGPHHAGVDPSEPHNTRGVTMPGEPFGMALTDDDQAIVITHQNDTKTSLFATGLGAPQAAPPSLQFVLDGVPIGGNGVVAVPHDPDAFGDPKRAPRPAFLETSRAVGQLDLLRYYADEGYLTPSSLARPFLINESTLSVGVNAGGSDSRGIVIDSTPRLACKAKVAPVDPSATPPRTDADVLAERAACARVPARVFFANRTPASIITGEIGEPAGPNDTAYDADRVVLYGSIPLSSGPSKLYLAPVVVSDGTLALRLFVVCFDSASVFVYDPDSGTLENIIRVAPGPFAMAFDPFSLEDVATHKHVAADSRAPGIDLKRYRFAYLASFTTSFVQVLDLDNSRPDKSTYETVVYTLGQPTLPKGS